MAGSSQSNDDDAISGINVTPLVDVMLVLLVIFMITAPVIYQTAIKIELPAAKTGEQRKNTPLSFTLSKDGRLQLDGHDVAMEELGAKVKAAMAKEPDGTAVIHADKDTPHGRVIELMDVLRDAGLLRFALSVQQKK